MTRTSLLTLTLLGATLSITALGCDDGSNQRPDDTKNDTDGDGYPDAEDCDDENPAIHPDATEVCDELDNNCNGETDEGVTTTYYQDSDTDGFGDPDVSVQACQKPDNYVTIPGDCNDADVNSYPNADEVCDGEDNDCDGTTDEEVGTTWYRDADSDGYGNASKTTLACDRPTGFVGDATDCNDADASIHPDAEETCNSIDDNCNGRTDEDAGWSLALDDDGDGFGDPGTTSIRCEGADNEWDCNDGNPAEPVVVDVATGSPGGLGTLSSPLDTIQAGVDAAVECVVVYPGTYYEAVHLTGGDIALTGVDGAESTIIDADGVGDAALTIDQGETAGTVVSGFTLTGGDGNLATAITSYSCVSWTTCYYYYYTYCGGGAYVSGSSPTLQDLLVQLNVLPVASVTGSGSAIYYTYSFGGGLCFVGSNSAMTGVDVWENYADQGGGVYVDEDSSVAFDQGWLVGNTATDGGGWQVDGGALALTNVASLFNDASSDGGGVYLVSGTATITNGAFAGDNAVNGGGFYASSTSTLTLGNSIVYGAGTGVGILVDRGSTFTGLYNDVFGNAGGGYSGITDPTGTSGNISSNPRFTTFTDDGDFSDDDLRLGSSSPCINTGNPSASYNDPDGSRNDMGAFGGPGGSW